MLDSIEDTKALLTAYAPGYVSRPDGSEERARPAGIRRASLVRVNPDLTTLQAGELVAAGDLPGESRYLSAGLIFARGSFCAEVPSDPGIYFHGEDVSLALRA
jgi:hypothetical protein